MEVFNQILNNLPQVGVAFTVIIAGVYAVVRLLGQDDQWKNLLDAKNVELDRLNHDLGDARHEVERLRTIEIAMPGLVEEIARLNKEINRLQREISRLRAALAKKT